MLEKFIMVTICSLLSIVVVPSVLSQSAPPEKEPVTRETVDQKLEKFLQEDEELREIYQCRFTGRLIEIPQQVQEQLDRAFPNYQFRIAEMEILIDIPWKKTKLIAITSRKEREVFAFVWGGMWTMPSKSFDKIVFGQITPSLDEAAQRVSAFAELLAETGPLSVGERAITSRRVEVDIVTKQDNAILRKLRLEIKPSNKLGKLLILRQDGKRISGLRSN